MVLGNILHGVQTPYRPQIAVTLSLGNNVAPIPAIAKKIKSQNRVPYVQPVGMPDPSQERVNTKDKIAALIKGVAKQNNNDLFWVHQLRATLMIDVTTDILPKLNAAAVKTFIIFEWHPEKQTTSKKDIFLGHHCARRSKTKCVCQNLDEKDWYVVRDNRQNCNKFDYETMSPLAWLLLVVRYNKFPIYHLEVNGNFVSR